TYNQKADNTAAVSLLSLSQENRRVYASDDASTFSSGSAVTDNGVGVSVFAGVTANADYGFRARFGNLSGAIGDTTETTNKMSIFEAHFFKDPITEANTAFQA